MKGSKSVRNKYALSSCWLIVLALTFSGCRPAQMSIPAALQSTSIIMEVSGRQNLSFDESFAIAPYKVTDVSRGWTRNTEWGIMMWGSSNADQSYNFILQHPGMIDFRIQCATNRSWQGLEFSNVFKDTLDIEYAVDANLLCELSSGKPSQLTSLVMKYDGKSGMLSGKASDGIMQINIQASNKLEGSPIALSNATGYIFSSAGQTIGAVDVINEGRIMIAGGVTRQKQNLLTAVSAALLLYRDLQE